MILIGIALVLLAILGAPLFAIIAAGALIGFAGSDIDLMVVPMEIFRVSEIPVLIAIPLFTFAGYLLGESQAPRRSGQGDQRATGVDAGRSRGGGAVRLRSLHRVHREPLESPSSRWVPCLYPRDRSRGLP